MGPIEALLDAVAGFVMRLFPSRGAKIAVLTMLVVLIALILYVTNSVKLARWLG